MQFVVYLTNGLTDCLDSFPTGFARIIVMNNRIKENKSQKLVIQQQKQIQNVAKKIYIQL